MNIGENNLFNQNSNIWPQSPFIFLYREQVMEKRGSSWNAFQHSVIMLSVLNKIFFFVCLFREYLVLFTTISSFFFFLFYWKFLIPFRSLFFSVASFFLVIDNWWFLSIFVPLPSNRKGPMTMPSLQFFKTARRIFGKFCMKLECFRWQKLTIPNFSELFSLLGKSQKIP